MTIQAERNAPLFTGDPLTWVDFDTHAEQTFRATEALDRWGKTWAYDPQLLAGYPNGAVFEVDNKGWELWTFALWKLGMRKASAFNAFVLIAHLLVAPVLHRCARLFGLQRWDALAATALGLLLWFFDGLARWSWYSGAVAFAIVTFAWILPLALMHRFLETRKLWLIAPLALTLGLGHLIHPSIFIMLVVPMVAIYVRSAKTLGWRRHAAIVGAAVFTIAVNAFWLVTAFRYAHYVTDHDPFFVAKPSQVLADFFGIIVDLTTTGLIGNRTAFRALILGLAAAGLALLWKAKDRRLLPLVSGIGFLLVLAYLGGQLWVFRQLQPYRNVVPAAFLCTIPAGFALGEIARRRTFHGLSRLGKGIGVMALLLGVSHLGREAMYFLPRSLPDIPALPTGETMPLTALGFPEHDDFRHGPPLQELNDITAWVKEHDDGQGRFLIDWWIIGEHLLWRTSAPVLGGFHERNLEHTAANFFKRHADGIAPDDEIARYFEDYAVRWVILTEERPYFESRSNLIELAAKVGRHRVYRTKTPVSWFQHGAGTIQASLNRIEVNGTDPSEEIVLRFHWMETLVCRGGCTLQRTTVDGDPVGFLRIPVPHPASFVIENGY